MMRRWLFGGFAVLCLLLFASGCWSSSDSLSLRIALTRASGYDGCLCADCYPRYGIGRGPSSGGCGCGRAAEETFSCMTACVGLASLGVAWLPLRIRPVPIGACAFCGYDISGLARCPECGLEPLPPLPDLVVIAGQPSIPPPTDSQDPTSPPPTPPARC